MEIIINNQIYQQAKIFAQQQGLSLSAVVESLLMRYIGHNKAKDEEEPVPDVVLSLLGAGKTGDEKEVDGQVACTPFYHGIS